MVNLIDHTYFRNRLQIANVVTDTDVQNEVATAIADYQYEFLNKILGAALYQQFVTWYGVNPSDDTSPFFYLLNGLTFTATNVDWWPCYSGWEWPLFWQTSTPTVTWVGLVNSQKQSPLANYSYFMYQRNNTTQTTAPGEVKVFAQNAVSANAYNKSKMAWDQMAGWLVPFRYFMDTFFSGPNTQTVASLLPYISPIQIKVGVTPGVVAGTSSFTFDGTGGKPDWRGYDIYPERIGQGTLVNSTYSWNKVTGVFMLLDNVFQPLEYFNFTFGLNGVSFIQITSNGYWNDYRYQFWYTGMTKILNPF